MVGFHAVYGVEEVKGSTGYQEIDEQLDHLYDLLAALNKEVAAARNEPGLTEAEIRDIVRDELDDQ